MSQASIPAIDRQTPKYKFFLMAIPLYLILVPITWLLKVIGKPGALFSFAGRQANKPQKLSKAFENYEPDEHDIFVSTFSKSGTNWMMQIAYQIAWRGEGEFENIHDVIPWPDPQGRRAQKQMIPLNNDVTKQLSPTGMRVIKTHFSTEYVPYNDKAKYLVVIRDPKEVFVSSYPFIAAIAGPIMPSVEVWLDMFLSKQWVMNFGNSWAEHSASYWALKDKPNVLLLSYSNLKNDPEAGIRKVAQTLGINLNKEEMTKVLEKSSFQYMKTIDYKFSPFAGNKIPWSEGFVMIREGKTGNASELISREQQIRIDNYFKQELKDIDSDFPYEEFCHITE